MEANVQVLPVSIEMSKATPIQQVLSNISQLWKIIEF